MDMDGFDRSVCLSLSFGTVDLQSSSNEQLLVTQDFMCQAVIVS
jgi:hypothetical protein